VPVRTFCAGFLQFGALGGEVDFGAAQEDEAEESFRTGSVVFRHGKAECRHCLVGGVPGAFFERGVVGVFFGWSDPDHEAGAHGISMRHKRKPET
jgi:hypothetical protein